MYKWESGQNPGRSGHCVGVFYATAIGAMEPVKITGKPLPRRRMRVKTLSQETCRLEINDKNFRRRSLSLSGLPLLQGGRTRQIAM